MRTLALPLTHEGELPHPILAEGSSTLLIWSQVHDVGIQYEKKTQT